MRTFLTVVIMLSGCKLGEKAAGSSGQEEKSAAPTAAPAPPKQRTERPSLRIQAIDPKKPAMSAEVTARLTAALETL